MSSMKMAYRTLTRRKARTILSISGIIVGVTMILVLLSLAAGTSNSTTNLLRSAVTAQITVTNSTTPTLSGFSAVPVSVTGGGPITCTTNCPTGGNGQYFIGNGAPGGAFASFFGGGNTIPESDATTIAGLKGVYAVSPELSTSGYVDNNTVLLYGIIPASFTEATTGLDLVNGSMLTSGNQVVLNSVLAQNLGVSVGSSVTLSYGELNSTNTGTTYTVVGIYSAGSTFGPTSRTAYIALTNAQNLTNRAGLVTEIDVKTSNPSLVHSVASEVQNSVAGVTASTGSGVTSEASLSSSLAIFFIVMGLVALLAGGFGVTNTMIMSISERTREIGTLRAIGAHKTQVMRIVMGESFLIGTVGAFSGAAIGIIIALILPFFTGSISTIGLFGGLLGGKLTTALIPSNILLSIALGVVVSVLAGIYPAMRASRMKPEEALRYG